MSEDPPAARPHMPGYGVLPADRGLLPWFWAERRLADSHEYWVSSVRPDGRPHAMPVRGVWLRRSLWFSSGVRSRKYRNLAERPACTVTTDDAHQPVVLDGDAAVVTDPERIARFLAALNEKYATAHAPEFLDPAVNATLRVAPRSVFALDDADFAGSPTRWTFPPR